MRNKPQSSTKPKAPRLPKQAGKMPLLAGQLEERTLYTQIRLQQNDLTGQSITGPSFDQVVFERVEMGSVQFKKAHVLDSCFNGCNLANGVWSEADFARVELLDSQLIGWQANEGKFQDALFKGCALPFAQLALATFQAVRFEECDLSEANFYQADLTGVVFTRCNLQRADFTGAKLFAADLRGSKIDGMRLGSLELMKGAFVDQAQALALVRSLGVNVEFLDGEPDA